MPGTDKVHKVSIIPRGIGSLGYTIQRPTEDRFLMTRQELENKMAVLLGGRAAEHIIFGELSTGAADDLVKVTDIARSIVTRYGMTEELGQVVYEKSQQSFLGGPEQPMAYAERGYSEETAREIDGAVKRIVDEAFRRTVNLLRAQREVLERGARRLLERETLDEADLLAAAPTRGGWRRRVARREINPGKDCAVSFARPMMRDANALAGTTVRKSAKTAVRAGIGRGTGVPDPVDVHVGGRIRTRRI